jgi:hypothetical protein
MFPQCPVSSLVEKPERRAKEILPFDQPYIEGTVQVSQQIRIDV